MIAGIDLGTTYSCISVFQDNRAILIPNALGEDLTPSVVSITDDNNILVGQAAKERLITYPDRTINNVKRFMGTQKDLSLGKKVFKPHEISSYILKALIEDAEKYLNEKLESVIITVPAYFQDSQRKATKLAGELAGIKVERIINEPTAASLAYSLHENVDDRTILIFDLGGGTFDVSILEIFEGIVEVRSTAGDTRLGGEDFNKAIFDLFCGSLPKKQMDKVLSDKGQLRNLLMKKMERLKIDLSSQQASGFEFEYEGLDFSWTLNKTDFERCAEGLLEKIRFPLEQALRDAKIKANNIDEIVLVGGATKMPMIRHAITQMFGRFPRASVDTDKVVGLGAGVLAGMHMRHESLNEKVLTDINPFSLGVEVAQQVGPDKYEMGLFKPIIERGTLIPVSKVYPLSTLVPGQTKLELKVYQGESHKASQNAFIGSMDIGVPVNYEKTENVNVRFTYDINGILEVEVEVVSTKRMHREVFAGDKNELSKAEIDARFRELEKLKIHPRDDQENKTLISQAERMYEEYIGEKREMISSLLLQFTAVLDKQDKREIEKARELFKEQLAVLDENPFIGE